MCLDGNKFITSKEMSLALGGNCKDFMSFASCKEFLKEYFNLNLWVLGTVELRNLQNL